MIGVFASAAFSLAKESSLEDALTRIRATGITALEVNTADFARYSPDVLRQAAEKSGMTVHSAHCLAPLCSPDPSTAGKAVETVRTAMENCARAGAKYIMLVPAYPDCISDEEDKLRAKEAIAASVNALMPHAAGLGLTVTMENFSRRLYPFSTSDELLWMTQNIPGLAITLDSGNFRFLGEDMPAAYEKLKAHIRLCHIKDWLVHPTEGIPTHDGKLLTATLIGRGLIPLSDLLFRMKTDRLSIPMIIEPDGQLPGISMEERLKSAVHFIQTKG